MRLARARHCLFGFLDCRGLRRQFASLPQRCGGGGEIEIRRFAHGLLRVCGGDAFDALPGRGVFGIDTERLPVARQRRLQLFSFQVAVRTAALHFAHAGQPRLRPGQVDVSGVGLPHLCDQGRTAG